MAGTAVHFIQALVNNSGEDMKKSGFNGNLINQNNIEFLNPMIGSPKANEIPKSYQLMHLPSIRPVKLQLPKTPQTEGDRRSLFDSMETDDAEDSLAAKIRPRVERRKFKASGDRRRPKSLPLRPHSATEMTQRPQVNTNNPIEFGDDDEIGMEPSIASAAPALRSVTPSTASGISFQCVSYCYKLYLSLFVSHLEISINSTIFNRLLLVYSRNFKVFDQTQLP
ncbi:unnamed protein product [Hymenolepis diminuta]|uniref:Uncharacterized protein n=1 Tax=Hymenolepis diminuta TaxID=6216 RepID=A0A0R3SLQ5_HYMDI|nr:unnamed protein product [Hymenolepis diminuta]